MSPDARRYRNRYGNASILSRSKTPTEIVGRIRPFLKITVQRPSNAAIAINNVRSVIISARGNERCLRERWHATIF